MDTITPGGVSCSSGHENPGLVPQWQETSLTVQASESESPLFKLGSTDRGLNLLGGFRSALLAGSLTTTGSANKKYKLYVMFFIKKNIYMFLL